METKKTSSSTNSEKKSNESEKKPNELLKQKNEAKTNVIKSCGCGCTFGKTN